MWDRCFLVHKYIRRCRSRHLVHLGYLCGSIRKILLICDGSIYHGIKFSFTPSLSDWSMSIEVYEKMKTKAKGLNLFNECLFFTRVTYFLLMLYCGILSDVHPCALLDPHTQLLLRYLAICLLRLSGNGFWNIFFSLNFLVLGWGFQSDW